MASISDVETALVTLIAGAAYPNGVTQPSVANVPIAVYAGWPTSSRLDPDLAAGKTHITVYPTATESNTTRFPKDWKPQTLNTATLSLTVSGQTVTVGGAMPSPFTPHVLSVLVNGIPYPYQVLSTDTIASIATALAALIAVGVPGTASAGGVITLPNTARINAARVGITGTSIRELRRQQRVIQITIWSDTPAHRDAVAGPVDIALAATEWLTMPDGFGARLVYRGSPELDSQQKAKLYRRDFLYSVEYATTQTEVDTQITQEQLNISAQPDGSTQYGPVTTTYF